MTWAQTTDAAELWRRAGAWLGERPVENAPLLAEVAHLLATDSAPEGLECGWWSDGSGAVGGAYVRAPRHNPLLTRMPRAALDELVPLLGSGADAVGVPSVVAADVVRAWAAAGTQADARAVLHGARARGAASCALLRGSSAHRRAG